MYTLCTYVHAYRDSYIEALPFIPTYMYMYMLLMRDESSKQGQTNKAKQHSTPKAVTFPKKNELPRVGLERKAYMYNSCIHY